MTKWLIFFLLLGAPAWGQSMVKAGSDIIQLRPPVEGCHCVALLYYENVVQKMSVPGEYTVSLGDTTITVRVQVGTTIEVQGDETLHVLGYLTGYTAMYQDEVVEAVRVPDGNSALIRILPAMS